MTERKGMILRLSAQQRARLDRVARKTERTRTALIREAIAAYLARYDRRGV